MSGSAAGRLPSPMFASALRRISSSFLTIGMRLPGLG
jgi:hypothetical protein